LTDRDQTDGIRIRRPGEKLNERSRSVPRAGTVVRIVLYSLVLIATYFVVTGLRGRIPMAFGLTPIGVRAVAMAISEYEAGAPMPGVAATTMSLVDVRVTVEIVGRDSLPDGLRLGQFRLTSDADGRYQPYASSLLFGVDGRRPIAPGDTLRGDLLFSLPRNERPDQLWWEP
jgi:hypothetical protein